MFNNAKWIWCNDAQKNDEYGEFYSSFDYSGEKMTLAISADSNYAVYLNGKLVSFGQYSDFPHDKVYDEIDISKDCTLGENHMAIVVWYYGQIKTSTYYIGNAGLMFELFANGESILWSDEQTLSRMSRTYRNHKTKKITPQLGISFAYDATAEDGWMIGALDGFCASSVVDQNLPLRVRPCEKLYLDPLVKGELVSEISVSDKIFDIGKNTVGFIYIDIESASEQDVVISYAEHLNDEGLVNRFVSTRDFSVEIRIKQGRTVYMNPFRRLGAKYLQIVGASEFKVNEIGIVPTMYPVNTMPRPALSEEDARIYDICEYTLRMCMHEHYEDCPWREQALYSMDSRNQMLCGYYAFGEYKFPRANLELISKDNREDDLLAICFPMSKGIAIPSYSLYYYISCAEYLKYSGDKELIKEIYPKLESILNAFLKQVREDGLAYPLEDAEYWNFYEWREGLDKIRKDGLGEADLILNALLSIALSNMAYMSDEIGVENEYRAMAERLNGKIKEVFYDPSIKLFRHRADSDILSAFGNSLAILCGAVEGEEARDVCESMLNNESVIMPSLSMQCFFYDALLKVDKDGYKQYVFDDIRKVYRPMVECGVGTVWETELGWHDFDDAGSLCHGWSALPIYYYHMFY